jgi:hypothetical protein
MRTRNPLVPAAIVAALTIGSLAACSSNGNSNYVTPQTPSSSSSSESSSPSASPSPSDGSSESPTPGALPSDFPKSDVPIVDGTVVAAQGDKASGWSVTVQPSGTTGFAAAKAALEAKGYKVQPGATDTAAVYSNGTYTVALTSSGTAVAYTVTAQ